ncbi:hypothetical protein AVEN_214737-1 [Araneus ventricosus]|uniref:Uncharacterized protein n=1 Tax=Araneus ventricosus TaxID=182803 RepID=A0A4Y2IF18_ARAVE|nr:hypothetical protein AVEN_214737-1 [Araneus ventricosus]
MIIPLSCRRVLQQSGVRGGATPPKVPPKPPDRHLFGGLRCHPLRSARVPAAGGGGAHRRLPGELRDGGGDEQLPREAEVLHRGRRRHLRKARMPPGDETLPQSGPYLCSEGDPEGPGPGRQRGEQGPGGQRLHGFHRGAPIRAPGHIGAPRRSQPAKAHAQTAAASRFHRTGLEQGRCGGGDVDRGGVVVCTQIAMEACLKGFENLVVSKGRGLSQRFPWQGLNLLAR